MSEAPRHPEVNQENTTTFEPNNQILAAPIDRDDALPLELRRHRLRLERAHEPRIEDLDTFEPAADERRLESCPDRLDLRQLGHGLRRRRRG
jgi:hypothetical protein